MFRLHIKGPERLAPQPSIAFHVTRTARQIVGRVCREALQVRKIEPVAHPHAIVVKLFPDRKRWRMDPGGARFPTGRAMNLRPSGHDGMPGRTFPSGLRKDARLTGHLPDSEEPVGIVRPPPWPSDIAPQSG